MRTAKIVDRSLWGQFLPAKEQVYGGSFPPSRSGPVSRAGGSEDEVIATVQQGERFPAKYGRTGFRRNFPFGKTWRDQTYATKQVEAYAIQEGEGWLVITVITRYF